METAIINAHHTSAKASKTSGRARGKQGVQHARDVDDHGEVLYCMQIQRVRQYEQIQTYERDDCLCTSSKNSDTASKTSKM